jgi:hypothetical protein
MIHGPKEIFDAPKNQTPKPLKEGTALSPPKRRKQKTPKRTSKFLLKASEVNNSIGTALLQVG